VEERVAAQEEVGGWERVDAEIDDPEFRPWPAMTPVVIRDQ
jgi:hypothetical protein